MKTAECVTPMHPDKMCDQISDAVLDFCLRQDPKSRVAIETLGGHGEVCVMGEITTKGVLTVGDVKQIAERIVGKSVLINANIVQQSPEIANGVDTGGAGDQGIMIGYACSDNEEMVPQEYYLARSLCKYIYARHAYDGKTQITLNDKGEINTVVASFQNVSENDLELAVFDWMKKLPVDNIEENRIVYCNPAGDWNQGGFDADTGLTGRKLMVDNYGPNISIGGGAFSGKDATKVDRSGAYIARYVAVDILKTNKAKRVVVKIAYAIGKAEPVMVDIVAIKEDGTILDSGWDLTKYDLTPKGIITTLDLEKPQYEKTAQWGHFGNGFTWDK